MTTQDDVVLPYVVVTDDDRRDLLSEHAEESAAIGAMLNANDEAARMQSSTRYKMMLREELYGL